MYRPNRPAQLAAVWALLPCVVDPGTTDALHYRSGFLSKLEPCIIYVGTLLFGVAKHIDKLLA